MALSHTQRNSDGVDLQCLPVNTTLPSTPLTMLRLFTRLSTWWAMALSYTQRNSDGVDLQCLPVNTTLPSSPLTVVRLSRRWVMALSHIEEQWWRRPATPASKCHTTKQSTHCVEVVHEIGDGIQSYRGVAVMQTQGQSGLTVGRQAVLYRRHRQIQELLDDLLVHLTLRWWHHTVHSSVKGVWISERQMASQKK